MNTMQIIPLGDYDVHLWGGFWFVTPPGLSIQDRAHLIDWGNKPTPREAEREAIRVIESLRFIDDNTEAPNA